MGVYLSSAYDQRQMILIWQGNKLLEVESICNRFYQQVRFTGQFKFGALNSPNTKALLNGIYSL